MDQKAVFGVVRVPRIAAVTYELVGLPAFRTVIGPRKNDLGKLAAIALDVEAEVCDNNHDNRMGL